MNLNRNLFILIKQETDVLKKDIKLELENLRNNESSDEEICEVDSDDDDDELKFRSSIYFAITLLTTIGK